MLLCCRAGEDRLGTIVRDDARRSTLRSRDRKKLGRIVLRRQPRHRLFFNPALRFLPRGDRPLGAGLRLDPKWSLSGGWTLLPVLTSSAWFSALRRWLRRSPGTLRVLHHLGTVGLGVLRHLGTVAVMAGDHAMLRDLSDRLFGLLRGAGGGRGCGRGDLAVARCSALRQNRSSKDARGNERNCYFAEHDMTFL